MTMPHLMNCSHVEDGWCLDCVAKMGDENIRLREQISKLQSNDGNATANQSEEIYTYTPNSPDQKITSGDAVIRFDQALALAQKNYKRVDRAWLGATAAQLFVEHPWIESFRVDLGKNDFDITVDEVRERKGVELPTEVITNKSFNFEEANLFVNEILAWHDVDAASAFDMFSKVIVRRERIESLLAGSEPICGETAFELLFPEEFASKEPQLLIPD